MRRSLIPLLLLLLWAGSWLVSSPIGDCVQMYRLSDLMHVVTDGRTDMVVRSLNGCAFPFYNNDGFAFQPPQLGHGVDDYEEEMTTMEKDAG